MVSNNPNQDQGQGGYQTPPPEQPVQPEPQAPEQVFPQQPPAPPQPPYPPQGAYPPQQPYPPQPGYPQQPQQAYPQQQPYPPQQGYPPQQAWQGYPGYAPQPPKKKMGKGAVIGLIVGALLLVAALGAGVYFLFFKDKGGPAPTETPTETSQPTEPTAVPTETEPPEPVFSAFAERILALDPYDAQHLSANPVFFYPHPNLNLALDLRNDPEAASMIYVFPVPNGFKITSRQSIIYEFGSLRDYPAGIDWTGNTVFVELLSAAQKDHVVDTLSSYDDPPVYDMVPFGEHFLYIYDTLSGGPDPAWMAKELYGGSIYFDHSFIRDRLVSMDAYDPDFEEPLVDSAAEWEEIVRMIQNNPAEFEWRYAMPPYSADPNAASLPNWELRENLVIEPLYEYGTFDLNDDGIPEHVVHAVADSYDYIELYGYWAVYTETPGGLRLIDFVNSGETDLLYKDEIFYHFSARGRLSEAYFYVEEHPTPVPVMNMRPLSGMTFLTLDSLIEIQDGGMSLNPYRNWDIVPTYYYEEVSGEVYLDFFVLDPEPFWQIMGDLSELSWSAKVIPARNPYNIMDGTTVFELEEAYTIGTIMDYLAGTYTAFPFSDDIWRNAVPVDDALSVGPPLTADKVYDLMPYPELIA